MSAAPNWAEQLTAIATAIGALGLLGAIVAAVYAGQQVREERKSRQSQMAAAFFQRWNDDTLVEARQLVASFNTPEELNVAFQAYVARNSHEAYVLYRELDFFEQLGALEERGAIDFELIKLLLGQILIERWELWKPAIESAYGAGVYPMFGALAAKMRQALER